MMNRNLRTDCIYMRKLLIKATHLQFWGDVYIWFSYIWCSKLKHGFFAYALFLLFLSPQIVSAAPDLSSCELRNFQITWYYSPLVDQEYYFQWDYDAETRLNGIWTHGASGRAVFNGMVAAPSTYAFGTQIYFPKYGRWQVEDRGGAIVEAGVRDNIYDRLDLWIGYGEEWLLKAVSLGFPTVQAYVCPPGTTSQLGFDHSQFTIYKNFFYTTLRFQQLWQWRDDPWVRELQSLLGRLWYMQDVTGYFWEVTKKWLCMFQQVRLWMTAGSEWCGHFWPTTRKALQQEINRIGAAQTIEKLPAHEVSLIVWESEGKDDDDDSDTDVDETIVPQIESEKDREGNIIWDTDPENLAKYRSGDAIWYMYRRHIPYGENSREVKLLQRKLQVMWHYRQDLNGIYDAYMREVVYELQRDHGVLTGDEGVQLRWYFGPGTRAAVNGWMYR